MKIGVITLKFLEMEKDGFLLIKINHIVIVEYWSAKTGITAQYAEIKNQRNPREE